MKKLSIFTLPIFSLLALSSCSGVGDRAASAVLIYMITAVLSFLLLVACCFLLNRNKTWFVVLFASVFVVNLGYLILSVSQTLEQALWANRIAYLGSVFLPLSMFIIILKVTELKYKKWLPYALVAVGILVFFVAASPGYFDFYYKEVSLETINGVSCLKKVYGPLHGVYLIYLIVYFLSMVLTITMATVKKKLASLSYAVILASAVFVNIGVWLIEQLAKIDFEILSVSYIISELFLLGLNLLIRENEKNAAMIVEQSVSEDPVVEEAHCAPKDPTDICEERLEQFKHGVSTLTNTEKTIYLLYTEGKSTKEIMKQLNIKENTLKFHNKNIYHKLGVSSRKQLIEIHKHL